MPNSAEVFTGNFRKPNITYVALVPNQQGYERDVAVNANEVAIFAAASEAFSTNY